MAGQATRATGTAQPSWSAGGGEAYADPRRYRWQGAGSEVRGPRLSAGARRLRRRLGVMFLLLAGLSAAFIYSLLFAPVKTPLIVIAAYDYDWPVPPNAWAREDVEGLKTLDEKTLRVLDTSAAWRSKKNGLAELDRRLRDVAGRRGNDGAVMFYVSMHGLVDERGAPCLLLPGASPLKSSDWLPVEELLERITATVPTDVQKVVLLDCARVEADWHLGVVRNTFAERLDELLARRQSANLYVVSSAGPGETSWASPDLRGSVFGRAVRMALAGACDLPAPRREDREQGGNRNGRVSVRELHRYVADETRRWTLANRGVQQNPRLSAAGNSSFEDFRLAWSLDRPHLNKLIEAEAATGRVADHVSLESLETLWRRLDAVRAVRPYQADPLAWRELEHRLLWLEQLSAAGEAYREAAGRVHAELREQLAAAAERAANLSRGTSLAARTGVVAPREFPAAAGRYHSLSADQFFGAGDPREAETVRAKLVQLAAPGNTDDLEIAWDRMPHADRIRGLAEVQFLRLARRYRAAEAWHDAGTARRGLELLDLADAATLGSDERAHYWLRPALDAADQLRRAAFDQFLIGPEKSVGDPWAAVKQAYDRVGAGQGSLRQTVEEAIAVRDRAAAEGPYFAQWLCRPGYRLAAASESPQSESGDDHQASAPPTIEDPVNLRLMPLLVNARKLAEMIDDRQARPTAGLPDFVVSARTVSSELDALTTEYLRAVDERLNESGADAGTLRDLQDALAIPLLPAEKRVAVLRKATALASSLHQATAAATGAPPAATSIVAFPQRVLGWHPHPLETLLGLEAKSAAPQPTNDDDRDPSVDLAAVEQMNSDARRRLLELPTLPLTDDSRAGDAPRVVYAATERDLRFAAAVAFAAPDIDPVARLRNFDLQQLLLWQARRTLDDFWGSPGTTASQSSSAPFFDTVARDLLTAARELFPPSASVERQFAELEQLLNARRLAARRGAAVAVETGSQETTGDVMAVDVVLKPGSATDGPLTAAASLPPGRGVVLARNVQGLLPTSRAAWTAPAPAAGERIALSGNVPPSLGSSFEAAAVFRGNEFAAPFMRPGVGGVVVEYVPSTPDTARVTLFGEKPQQSSVVFILDCSSSMATEMPVELIDAQRLPRLEIAKSALEALLEQLAIRADTRVGVRFFGHRAGWAKAELSKMLTQTNYAGPIPDDINPSEDVELVLPLGRFDSIEAGLVSTRLRSVLPWGQSPLYLSIEQAIRDFDADKTDNEKSIVVITDGANYQFTPAGGAFAAPAHRTLADALAASRGKNVPVYILGFGVSQDGDAAAEREFITLAEQTGGRYFPITNGRDLLAALRERLGLGSYQVENAGNQAAGKAPTKLNVPVGISGLKHGQATYTVRFQNESKDVVLEGGEALELFASRDGGIVARPYDRGLPVQDVLSADGQPRRLTVGAHRPERSGDTVRFPVSLEDRDSHFTPRPKELWIEATPVVKAGGDPPPIYVFYDRRFEPDAPVPLAVWTATHWPAESKQAKLQVWCKYSQTEPNETVPLADVVDRREEFVAGRPLRALEGCSYRVQLTEKLDDAAPYEIKIVEEHGSASPGIPSLKVLLETDPALTPRRVVRRFDARRGVAIHSYWFDGATARRVLDSPLSRITFTLRSATREGAWQLENGRPLTVDIYGAGDVLPLDAATGVR